jgi:hypothetical protein
VVPVPHVARWWTPDTTAGAKRSGSTTRTATRHRSAGGVGTTLIATLVTEIRRRHPAAGILADPDAANMASRRVLEKNGFHLTAVRPVATEASNAPMAIYRLPSAAACH